MFGKDTPQAASPSPVATPVAGGAQSPLAGTSYAAGSSALSPNGASAGPQSCPVPAPDKPKSCDVKPADGEKLPEKPKDEWLTNRRFQGDSTLLAVVKGQRTLGSGAKGGPVRRVQAALESLGHPTGSTRLDGDYGDNTVQGVTQFQKAEYLENYSKEGVVDQSTMARLDAVTPQAGAEAYEWREAEYNTDKTPKRSTLTNPRFQGDVVLETLISGIGGLTKGQTGKHVWRVQTALSELGFTKVKATGTYDADTVAGVGAFQDAFNVPLQGKQDGAQATFSGESEKQSGLLNPTTMAALDAYAPKTLPKEDTLPELPKSGGPDYKKLFADGKLEITLAMGYDEGGAHTRKRPAAIQYLTKELGFAMTDPRAATEPELTAVGLDPKSVDRELLYFTRKMTSKAVGKEVNVVVKLLSAKDDGSMGDANRDRFKAALEKDDVVMYTGHARAGTGPDFDAHDSDKGNYVMGEGYNKKYNKEVAGAENQLDKTNFTDQKQVYLFWGCTTENYDKHLDKKLGKPGSGGKRDSKDIVVSNQPVYSDRGLIGTLAFLRGLMAEADGGTLKSLLDSSMRTQIAKTEGFGS